MPIKLLIFDLDGTLVDTKEDITDALNHALAPLGIPHLTPEKTVTMVGEGLTKLVEKVLGQAYIHRQAEVMKRFLDYYSAHIADKSRPYPYVKDVLTKLGGMKKAVLSNKREGLSVGLLKALGLDGHFDMVIGSDTISAKKPSPEPIRHIIKYLQETRETTAIVGDSIYDLQAGKSAGILTLSVTYGYGTKEALKDADYLIDNPNELIYLLSRHRDLMERRKETRFSVPGVFQKYITLNMKIAEDFIPCEVIDFSEHGMKIRSHIPLDSGTQRECTLSVQRSLEREIHLTISIRHCTEKEDGSYQIGSEIVSVGSEMWFKVFKNIVKFITDREGEVF